MTVRDLAITGGGAPVDMSPDRISPSRRPAGRPAARVAGAVVLVTVLTAAIVATAFPGADPPDQPTGPVTVCVNDACHRSIVDRAVMHGPAAQHSCDSCHEVADAEHHLFRLTAPRDALCRDCHELELDRVVHAPVGAGDCTGCHDPHGSRHRMLLRQDPTKGLCRSCHEDIFADQEHVHGPVAVGACVVCHDPHSSGQPFLLTNAPNQLCADCHAELIPRGAARLHEHAAMQEGCTSCHDPHASEHVFQLRAKVPDLCFSCHDSMKDELAAAIVTHGPAAEEGGCVLCHDPHFSPLPRLQRVAQPDLCLRCHDREIETPAGRTLTNVAALLADNPDHHGPIRDGNCAACHQPHGGERFGMLLLEYPPDFYAPFRPERYALCFACHLSDLVLDESGTGLTGFRQADQNLHWLHVNKEKGRTCRACHEVHASKRPFHIRESVPFGSAGWMLEINYEKTDDGGRCAPGCHKPRSYERSPAAMSGDQAP